MTPQLTLHLTEDQFGELLAHSAPAGDATSAPVQVHLLACEQCAAELAALRESLSLFRQASIAYAGNELRRLPQVALPSRRIFSPALEPTHWVAAAAIFLAALLPVQSLRQHTFRAAPAVSAGIANSASESESESDEALLEDVDRDASASVPAPMQALVDPTATISIAITASLPTSDQRKD